MQICIKSNACFFLMLSSSQAEKSSTPEILQREVGEKERKKRQPAGGGKTKGKVSESKERERTGEGKHRQAGRGGGERLSAGAPIDPVSFLSYIKRTPS